MSYNWEGPSEKQLLRALHRWKSSSLCGVRITRQRRLLVGIIQDSPRHLDAATVLGIAKQRDSDIDPATVYRTLALLKNRGLIDELDLMHLEGEKHYYETKPAAIIAIWRASGAEPSSSTRVGGSKN
jgi:Fe2+ or Zn2+ uptake regulation protein